MRILLAHFEIQDYGGIINYTENLIKGFKENEHDVETVMLKNKGATGLPKIKDRSQEQGWELSSGSGLYVHQKKGWEGMYRLNYKDNLPAWNQMRSEFDLVIFVIPVPTCTKANKEDISWLEVFANPTCKQLSVIHDGNLQKLYPHIIETEQYLSGVICVHDAAFNSAEVLEVPRMLIPNPHNVEEVDFAAPIENRYNAIVSLQTFKRWKRVDDLVRAIPHMDSNIEKLICGGGIEYHYMTSKTKVKKEYLTEDGTPIWDEAELAGMEFLGYVDTNKRDELLATSKLLIDPSWSKTYSQFGAHFNRVMVEAMVQGCVPVCTNLGMANSTIFKKNVNYLEIPYDISPEEYGELVSEWVGNTELLSTIQSNNLKLVEQFSSYNIAESIIEFTDDPDFDGVVGNHTEKLKQDSEKKMSHFYGL